MDTCEPGRPEWRTILHAITHNIHTYMKAAVGGCAVVSFADPSLRSAVLALGREVSVIL